MASITIRNLDAQLKARLRVLAARHDRSMEEEVRHILRQAVADEQDTVVDLPTSIAACFRSVGGVDLKIPARERMRAPPKLK